MQAAAYELNRWRDAEMAAGSRTAGPMRAAAHRPGAAAIPPPQSRAASPCRPAPGCGGHLNHCGRRSRRRPTAGPAMVGVQS
jgi:hypothetical protein